MKYLIALVAAFSLLGFVSSAQAKEGGKPKPGHFIKADAKELTYKGGKKGKGEEHTIKIDESTRVTVDGKDAKLADLKADEFIEITEVKGVATLIAASTTGPATEPSKSTKVKTEDSGKTTVDKK